MSFVESANFEPAGCEYLQAKVRKPTLPRSMCQSDTEYWLKDAGPPKVHLKRTGMETINVAVQAGVGGGGRKGEGATAPRK